MNIQCFKNVLTAVLFLCSVASYAAGETLNMTVGETKTLHLPYSVTSKYLKSCYFYAASPEYVDIQSYSVYSVTVIAKKAISTPVIIRCDYIYYELRNGRYVYGGRGAYDFCIRVKDIPVTSISLPAEVSMEVGQSRTLKPTITPYNATSELTWESSNFYIVNVDQNGKILAQRPGTSKITVTSSNGVSASCIVTAAYPEVAVTSLLIMPSTLTLEVGESSSLTAIVSPSNATDKSVAWSSSDKNVAAVTADGKVTAISAGSAKIYALSANGKGDTSYVTCKKKTPDLVLNDLQDAPQIPDIANVSYSRILYAGWNSMCVPFAFESSYVEGCKLATIKEMDVRGQERYFSFSCVQSVPAGMPCLIWVEKDTELNLSLPGQTLAQTPLDTGIMKGSYSKSVIGAGCYKLSSAGDSFSVTQKDNAIVSPFRTYIITNK